METADRDREIRRKERRRRKRRRHHSDESEDDEEPSEFPQWKTMVVIAIIVGCFAILYPKMFHPMLMFALGLNTPEKEREPTSPHPPMRGPPPGNNDPHLHAGPHPAMRGAAGMGGRVAEASGKGKGMWHWMLPFYTVGVIVFLLYTLSKIMWKKPNKPKSKAKQIRRRLAGEDSSDSQSSSSEEEEEEDTGRGKLSAKELTALQKRLNQTEGAMQKILGQLESLSGSVDSETAEQVKAMTMETLNNLARVEASSSALADEDARPSKKKGRKKEPPPAEVDNVKQGKYLEDLEKALSEFKKFTEDYIQDHAEAAIKEELDHMSSEKGTRRENELNERRELEEGDDDDSEEEDRQAPSRESENTDDGLAPGAVEEEAATSEADSEEEDAAEDSTEGAEPSRGFDVMEAEKDGILPVGETTGEVVTINGHDDAAPQNRVRKRQRRT